MKWHRYKTAPARLKHDPSTVWKEWFAWYPVVVQEGFDFNWLWLTTVERCPTTAWFAKEPWLYRKAWRLAEETLTLKR